MRTKTLAHVSDLHLGHSPARDAAAAELCRALVQAQVDHVVVTGDVTHRGRNPELARFERIFAPLLHQRRLSVVPGNHDRCGDDAGARLLHGERVAVHEEDGLFLVLVDSTAPHNKRAINAHGSVCRQVLEQVYLALGAAPAGALRVLALHHHVLPLPEEGLLEKLASALGLPHAGELSLGPELLRLISGRCDLVLHGHRHVPRALSLTGLDGATVSIYNAGSSTELRKVRVFDHRAGRLLSPPVWLTTGDLRAPVRVGPPAFTEALARYPNFPVTESSVRFSRGLRNTCSAGPCSTTRPS